MDTFSEIALLVLGLVVFTNYKNGTLGDWFRSKFLNAAAPKPEGSAAWPDGLSGGDFGPPEAGGAAWKPGNPLQQLLGRLYHPVPGGRQTSDYGPRGGRHHDGVDWGTPIGTPVRAAASGRVVQAGPVGTYGNLVTVDHGNGVTTRYAHLDTIGVRIGDNVTAGTPIARSGNTGRSTGPNLHFEVRHNGVPSDPLPYLRGLGLGSKAVTA